MNQAFVLYAACSLIHPGTLYMRDYISLQDETIPMYAHRIIQDEKMQVTYIYIMLKEIGKQCFSLSFDFFIYFRGGSRRNLRDIVLASS